MTNSNDDASDTGSKEKLEQVFSLIKDGKSMRGTDLWGAANKFSEARSLLELLATEHPRSTEEEKQIATLYERQAREYLKESRQCLIDVGCCNRRFWASAFSNGRKRYGESWRYWYSFKHLWTPAKVQLLDDAQSNHRAVEQRSSPLSLLRQHRRK